MDLISREAVVEYFMTNMGWYDVDGYKVDDADKIRTCIEDLINGIPSVPAVPLDKLYELCEETDAKTPVPCILCHKIMPGWCKQNNNLPLKWDEEWKCPTWKQLLTEWMEGLE